MTRREYADSVNFRMSHFPEPNKECDEEFVKFVNTIKEICEDVQREKKLRLSSAYGRCCYGR